MNTQSKTLRFSFFALIYFAEGVILGYFASLNALYLLGNGIDAQLEAALQAAADEKAALRLRHQAKQLLLPEAMGERFGVMGFEREASLEHAFLVGDLSWRL